jgi:RNA polymerase sigma factor (sigma-70 family)
MKQWREKSRQEVSDLIEEHLDGAMWHAQRYRNMYNTTLDEDEIRSGALEGLWKAAERWNPSKGRMMTYMGWWVVQTLQRRNHSQGGIMRLPEWLRVPYEKACILALEHQQAGLALPTSEELQAEFRLTQKAALALQVYLQSHLSLQEHCGSGGETVGETVVAITIESIEQQVFCKLRREAIDAAIDDALSHREADIIRNRYGFAFDAPSQARLAQKHGISRQRVQQIEQRALDKLRKRITNTWIKEDAA